MDCGIGIEHGPHASRAKARRHRRCASVGVAMDCDAAGDARGVSWGGLAPVVPDLQSGLERDSNPRLSVFNRCSTQLSYPVVDVPDSNRRPAACAAALPLSQRRFVEHRLPIPGMRHGSAARTGRACKPVPLWSVRRCSALAPRQKRQSVVRSHPLAARAEASRHGASLRLRGVSLPRASNARMLRERDAIAFDPVVPLCERQNENAPGCWNPRAFAWPREIGVTDLRDAKDQSMLVVP